MKVNYFLKQSARKIIFLVLIIPIITQFILINLVQNIRDGKFYYLTFIMFWLLYFPYFYWLNIVVEFLYNYSNKHFDIKLKTFKISLGIILIVSLNFVLFIAYIFSFVFKGGKPSISVIFCIFLIQIIGMIFFIYNSYFVCKLITTIELKRSVSFIDIVPYLIVYLFPPIAIWIIQNKVIKLQNEIRENSTKTGNVPNV